ncbi:hypothetical protein BPAE_0196g00110 [Botrytis paeoniae]|uniref:Uncharacterized protein n=1 Tax=Botrytis paeoniae TaxID=278948 RepID=A0A4Z1FEX0_9HELO|nr:hypothetical protein BPAE_0196g00110 [Botrytis paeoniae]
MQIDRMISNKVRGFIVAIGMKQYVLPDPSSHDYLLTSTCVPDDDEISKKRMPKRLPLAPLPPQYAHRSRH